MEKYLGNKRVLLDDILQFTIKNCPDATSVNDIFTGTTNVARMFRRNGYRVYANDANRFSYVLGKTYLDLQNYPKFNGVDFDININNIPDLKLRFHSDVRRDKGILFDNEKSLYVLDMLYSAKKLFNYLNSLTKKIKGVDYHIYDSYTIYGNKSYFKSIRGTEGKRNYFSEGNAILIDNILHYLREWWRDNLISKEELYFILTSVIEEVVLVANVSGTFHDFNRNKLWPNSLQRFHLKLPITYVSKTKSEIFNNDALELSLKLPKHDVLYIDPPYNFRQYTAYYHFLNFIAIYPFLDDVTAYLSKIEFVRGQKVDDDFTSQFCFKDKFMEKLDKLIRSTDCRYVIMSYYGGRNHWNHWSKTEKPTDLGFLMLEEYFSSSIFCGLSSTSVSKLRQNYQSRVGEKKSVIDEYLFFAKKTQSTEELDIKPYASERESYLLGNTQ